MLNGLNSNDRRIGRRAGPLTLANEAGSLILPVRISADVPDGVAPVPKGRWPKLEPSQANVNALNPGLRTDIANSSAVHGIEVTITRNAPTQ
jgi:anaerobic selenocysteine-containing dehydrogenase